MLDSVTTYERFLNKSTASYGDMCYINEITFKMVIVTNII